MRRLLLIIPSLSSGGAERVISILANMWNEAGYVVTLVTFSGKGESDFFPIAPGVIRIHLGKLKNSRGWIQPLFANCNRARSLRKVCVEARPDIVISFMTATNVIVLLSCLGKGIPVVVSERNNPECYPRSTIWRLLRCLTYMWADAVVAQNWRSREFFSQRIRSRTEIIPNPVLVLCPLNVKPRDRIVAMGRLTQAKGFDLLIQAFSKIESDMPGWELMIYGEGPERADLQALIKKLGLSNRVTLAGRTSQPWEAMRSGKIFVLSSRYEGMPNVLCEAMSLGIPVVAFDCPTGPGELIEDGVNGLLVPAEDVEALGAKIRAMALNEEMSFKMGSAAAEISKELSLEKIGAIWEVLFSKVTRRRQQK